MIKILSYTGQIPGLTVEVWPPNKPNDLQGMAREAKTEMAYIRSIGFPDAVVNIVDCAAQYRGLHELNQIWIFADTINSEPAVVRGLVAHEYGHHAHNIVRRAGLDADYWRERGGIVGPAGEIFADDWKRLFASEIACTHPIPDYGAGGPLGWNFPPEIQKALGYTAKHDRLRAIIMDAVRRDPESPPAPSPAPQPNPQPEAPEPPKPGASVFSDVAQDRWSRPAIEQAHERGLMTGYPDGTFKPGQAVTREELATVVVRLDDRLQQILEQKGVK